MEEHDPIYVTGASGYLGQHIMRIGGPTVRELPRKDWSRATGRVVIHAAWSGVPKTGAPMPYQGDNTVLAHRLIADRPRFIVFVSTRTGSGAYLMFKRTVEKQLQESSIPCHIVRFPGLFGPPRRQGIVYRATRAALLAEVLPALSASADWTTMHVEEAAVLCLDLAREHEIGATEACSPLIEEWLDFCRSDP